MAKIVTSRPLTPGQRFKVTVRRKISKARPEKGLVKAKKNSAGRNCYGRITSRRRGGGHKRHIRVIDYSRDKLNIPAKVQDIQYDPNRSARIALLAYADGEKRYILAPRNVEIGDTVLSSDGKIAFEPGNNMPLRDLPPASRIHNIELQPGGGGKLCRAAGATARLVAVEGDRATIKMPSGEVRMLHAGCRATYGQVGNLEHGKETIGKAGRSRWKSRRPRVRGVAMNPVDHPMGGGEGRTSGGGHPVSPWGQLSKGFPTRRKRKASDRMILIRRDGRKMKQ